MRRTVILDNGHGGSIGGVYQTAGKRSPKWGSGVLYEGEFNRWIVNGIIKELDYLEIPYYHISPELKDISLSKRVGRANAIQEKTWLLSIHANAGGGEGTEVFTSKGETYSDPIASSVVSELEKFAKVRKDYSDGDSDKEENFYILRNTSMPAVLVECGFMDNEEDYERLFDAEYQKKLIDAFIEVILKEYEI